jgi:hypothetical protein
MDASTHWQLQLQSKSGRLKIASPGARASLIHAWRPKTEGAKTARMSVRVTGVVVKRMVQEKVREGWLGAGSNRPLLSLFIRWRSVRRHY